MKEAHTLPAIPACRRSTDWLGLRMGREACELCCWNECECVQSTLWWAAGGTAPQEALVHCQGRGSASGLGSWTGHRPCDTLISPLPLRAPPPPKKQLIFFFYLMSKDGRDRPIRQTPTPPPRVCFGTRTECKEFFWECISLSILEADL